MALTVSIAGKDFLLDAVTVDGVPGVVLLDKLGFGAGGAWSEISAASPLPVQAIAGATEAKQDALQATLVAALGTPSADDILALLRQVATNTAGEVARVDTLNLTADQIQLDVDTLEALLAPSTPTNLPAASGVIVGATGALMGVSARETTGNATAFFRLRAGSAAGAILATVTLAANESIRDWYGPSGIAAAGGVYFELVSGAVAGGVQTR